MSISYRVMGLIWFVIGLIAGLTAVAYFVAYDLINGFYIANFPVTSMVMSSFVVDLDAYAPGLQQVLGVVIAAFFMYYGLALIQLKGWTRTVGVSIHLGMGICVITLALLLYFTINSSATILQLLPNWAPLVELLLGLGLGFYLLYTGVHLTQHDSLVIFAGRMDVVTQPPQVACPTCGGQMDMKNGTCPKCDGVNESLPVLGKPRLVDLSRGKEFTVNTIQRTTRIGRDNPGFEVLLVDPSVSTDHAEIEFTDGYFYLHAHKDTNGTFVNDVQVRDTEIKDNDRLRFGRVEMIFLTKE